MSFASFVSVTLADLGDFSNGVNFGKEAMGSGYGIINVNDIFRSGIKLDFDALDKVDLSNLNRIANYTVRQNDLFFVRSSVKRDGVGLVSYSSSSDGTVVHCGFVIRFRLRDARANPLFLAYALRSPFYRETLKNLSNGTAIINISQSAIGSVKIDLPPRNIQGRIALTLSAYDHLIENNTRRIKILEEMAQMIYREWFVNFRFPGHEKVRMVDSELGPIPEGWEPTNVGDHCAEVRRGVHPSELDPETPYIGLEHIPIPTTAVTLGTAAALAEKLGAADLIKRVIGPSLDLMGERTRKRFEKVLGKSAEMMDDARINPQPIADRTLVPLLEGVSLENDPTLQDMWAALLANAATRGGQARVRPGFIALLKQMDSQEALLLKKLSADHVVEVTGENEFRRYGVDENTLFDYHLIEAFSEKLGKMADDRLSLDGLIAQQLVRESYWVQNDGVYAELDSPIDGENELTYRLTRRGTAFIEACEPPKTVSFT